MTTYNTTRVRELANKKLIKDTGNEDIEPLSNKEFYLYCILQNATKDINNWKFYLSDDIYEEIIDPFVKSYGVHTAFVEDFTIDECLEQIKLEREIEGFIELSEDLYMIKE